MTRILRAVVSVRVPDNSSYVEGDLHHALGTTLVEAAAYFERQFQGDRRDPFYEPSVSRFSTILEAEKRKRRVGK